VTGGRAGRRAPLGRSRAEVLDIAAGMYLAQPTFEGGCINERRALVSMKAKAYALVDRA
jgi:hypothetical protein